MKQRVAVIGATGYGGAEIVRILTDHPFVEVTTVTSGRLAGVALRQECPWLDTDLILTAPDPAATDAEIVFLCQEAGYAQDHAHEFTGRVIDLSADFRLRDPDVYESTYGRAWTSPYQPGEIVYGLCETLTVEDYATARVIANPGCYPTATALALLPLADAIRQHGSVPVIDAKSGVSGAGRAKGDPIYRFSEQTDNFRGYALTGHRHVPEIEQTTGLRIRFSPSLLPIARGLIASVYVSLPRADYLDQFRAFYAGAAFVRVVESVPSVKQVAGSNRCDIHVTYDDHTEMAIVTSVIDNLGKGAAGQAIQNMNRWMGWPETAGLPRHGVWP